MKKLLSIFIMLFILTSSTNAKVVKKDFSTVINDSGVDVESIAVSIKDLSNGKIVYALNDKMLMNPASVQKILTTPVAAEILGEDYLFKTGVYSRTDDSYLIKLGADPYLKTSDIKELVKSIKPDVKKIYIDDTALDTKTWGEGWQWDDDMNILMPRFSSYNLDKNLIKLTIMPPSEGQFATIINPSKYPLVFFNHITASDKTNIDIHRDNAISANTLMLSGTVARPTTIFIPNNNLKSYFKLQLTKALEDKNIYLKQTYISDVKVEGDVLFKEVTHDIKTAINDVLKNSNNLVSETMFKLAGAKYIGIQTGSDTAGIKMFNDYCSRNKLDNSRIRITDASGVSKNNLVSADFITEFLNLNKNNPIMQSLARPGEGTLTHRMLPIKNNLQAKTGTLSDLSSIAGYLTSKNDKKYAFCIMINDIKMSASDKKMLEDFLIREAYLRL